MSWLSFNMWMWARRGPELSPWSTHLCPNSFCAKHSLYTWCSNLYPGPFSDHSYSPEGLLQLLKPVTCSPYKAAGQRVRKQIISEVLPANDRWAWRGNAPAVLSRESRKAVCSSWLQESPTDTKSQWSQELLAWQCVFHQFTPSFLPWPLSHYFLSQYGLQLRFLMFLSGIYFSGSSDPGKNQRKAGGHGNSDHKSRHPTSGPHPGF